MSRELWSHLVTKGAIPDPRAVIEPCPHMSFVWGDENVTFLRDRYKAMSAYHCYFSKTKPYWEDPILVVRTSSKPEWKDS